QHVRELRFGRARFGLPFVAPLHDRRQRHEDRLRAAARLQPEERAAVPYEVELDVAPAAVRLEVALALAVFAIAALLDDRNVRRKERVAHGAHHREALREIQLAEVVEERAADAARLVAVLEEEIFVARLLETLVQSRKRRERVAVGAVEMHAVL